jgi:hypothetical protein
MPEGKSGPVASKQVFVSSPTGFQVSLTFLADDYEIDVASKPARIAQILGDCVRGTRCKEQIWVWSHIASVFTPKQEVHR